MLSTNAPTNGRAEQQPRSRRGSSCRRPGRPAQSPMRWMTPVSTRPPTMTNRPMKKTSVDHSTSARYLGGRPGRRARAARRRAGPRWPGSTWMTACSANPATTSASTRAPDQQPPVGDRRPLVEGHDLGDALRVVLERLRNMHPAQQHEQDEQDHDDRRHVHEEVVERQPGAAGDDDVRRVADERRRAADVGREHLGDEVRRGGRSEPRHTRTVTGATSMMVVTLSRNGDATAVMTMSSTSSL